MAAKKTNSKGGAKNEGLKDYAVAILVNKSAREAFDAINNVRARAREFDTKELHRQIATN